MKRLNRFSIDLLLCSCAAIASLVPMAVFHPIYRRLREALGPSQWWPAESPFEVIVGAILTQNTSWKNVEKAILTLRAATDLQPEHILKLPVDDLAQLIRSSGYYNQKASRLIEFLRWFSAWDFSIDRLRRSAPPDDLRLQLLARKGIGPETADSILCYALELPFFVVDAYSYRLAQRLELAVPLAYEPFRKAVESEFRQLYSGDEMTQHLNEFHALIVRHGNTICRKRSPQCSDCAMRTAKGLTGDLQFRTCRYDSLNI